MRCKTVHPQADELVYEIRGIVASARRIEMAGLDISWENIGDPVAKGERVPDWIVEHVQAVVRDNASWAYSPTRGYSETVQFLAGLNNAFGGAQIDPDDILFFNGLGDAVSTLYRYMDAGARVLSPSPCYPSHASQERFHAGGGADGVHYRLYPDRGWLPDLDEIRDAVKNNRQIAAITLINPDNPTGAIWPEELLRGVVEIAGEFGLFVVADEIYARLAHDGQGMPALSRVIGDVPGISMKGISKEYPWPGSRCGWIEVYNGDSDPDFRRYAISLTDAKMLEVCSTTQPQMSIPRVMGDSRYGPHLKERCRKFAARAEQFREAFDGLEGVKAVKPEGAFYAVVAFEPDALNLRQSLKAANPEARGVLMETLEKAGSSPDKRLVMHLLASTGICVVPLSGFSTDMPGFRMTLLENDEEKRSWILATLREKIEEYLRSA